jgi:MGT family glycosyltransferase
MTQPKVIAFFPEASFGAALNCVGIAQQLRSLGARPVFICHPGFRGVFAEYGFPEYPLPSLGAESQTDWTDFINRHQDAFRQTPLEQIKSYVAPTWDAIVDTAIAAEEPLRQLLAQLKPDIIALDNVVMFPAIANAGVPWVRIVSCAETELPDPMVPPYLSGCGGEQAGDWMLFADRYRQAITPAHRRMNSFLAECGLKARPPGEFLESSPFLNLLLSPDAVRFERQAPLDAKTHVYLNGCVRQEAAYALPAFAAHQEAPLVLTSFGSLGAMDVTLIQRMIRVFETMPYRFIVNVGPWRDDYARVPDNVFLESWFPQPSVVAQSSLFIHHGGNNSFCEALYYGVPSLIMSYCWDGHDNARRAQDVGVGQRIDRYQWSNEALAAAITGLLGDHAMKDRLVANSRAMKQANGAAVAARAILDLV